MKMLMMIILFCILIYPAMATEDIVIEDFENSRFIKWKAEGSAFGDGPVDRTLEEQDEVTGYKGKRYVNSYHGGDDATGTLTSPEFTIQRDYINFLIGGGGFIDKTCVNLILDDEVVRTASTPLTGDDETEFLDAQSWARFKGQNGAYSNH
jgi:hypothetical protein